MADCIRVYASQLECSGPNLFWAARVSETLFFSLRDMGQLEPVLVRPHGDGYALLSGYQRVAFLAEEGQEVMARVLPGPGSPLEDGLIYLHANLHRPLDESLRIRALRYFQPMLGPDGLARRIAPILGLPPRSGTWRNHLAWLALPASWDALLHAGNIPLAAGTILADLPQDAQKALQPYFSAWKWSQGRAVQWLTLLREAALHRGCSVKHILEASASPQTLDVGLAPQDALQRLTAQARAVRFPHLDRMERRFAALAKELLGSSRWKITPTPNFESDSVTLQLQARNAEEWRLAARDLHRSATSTSLSGTLEDLFQVVCEEDHPGS